ncbi:hypothetical protein B0A52_05448 [Exophiala mesophila]|uniref:Uncharacterized protein n=1 Tax=Exophiala mesophila TaxID=212818 RepID=A0A438N4Z3_EXOME|nr:hypothetical protein B0A52_05448 [Exophiala mesophila]
MASTPVVFVTGAAGGVGFAIVRALLEERNASVIASDIVKGDLEQLQASHSNKLEVVVGDITKESTSIEAVSKAVERFGGLTGVCLNAGTFGPCHRLNNADPEKWIKAMNVNLFSHLYTLKHAIPHLRKSEGTIIFTTSAAGLQALFPGWGFYGTSKAAVAFVVKQLQLEEPTLTVLGVAPGLCDTKMIHVLAEGGYDGWTAEDAKNYKEISSTWTLTKPAEAGRAYAYAVTKASREIGGSVVEFNDPIIQALLP